MSPLEFMQRLAALVPRPRLHLIRFHGVLAPNAGLRAAIVPGPGQKPGEPADEHAHGAPARMGWARLLKRVFDLDLEHCPQCGGAFRIIAAIEERAVIVGYYEDGASGPSHKVYLNYWVTKSLGLGLMDSNSGRGPRLVFPLGEKANLWVALLRDRATGSSNAIAAVNCQF